jgi:geranylgeranyl diphosphate synthase type I
VDAALDSFLAERTGDLARVDPSLTRLAHELRAMVFAGGKRVRPLLAVWGYTAAGREPDPAMATAAAALELVHCFALVQDDVMDGSTQRRGRPATHMVLGQNGALLASDLALIWADRMLLEAGFEGRALAGAFDIFNHLRVEVTLGQYLDLQASALEDHALKVNLYKTASYTVLRPIQLGMALGGADQALIDSVPAYAEPAGIAFQLRDDLLGAFGNPDVTGKSDHEDLLRRKPTWLRAKALALDPLGDPDPTNLIAVRHWLLRSGAVAATEAKIHELRRRAIAALRKMPVERRLQAELEDLTTSFVERTS